MPSWQAAICRLYHGHPARGGSARGTACFVAPDRLLTAAHLVRDIPAARVYLHGLPKDATERLIDTRCHPTLDLAWLRIGAPQPIRPLRIDPRPLPSGVALTLCGFPDPESALRTARHRLIARDGSFQLGIVQGYPGKGFSGGPALLGMAPGAGGPWTGLITKVFPPRIAGICSARHTDRNEGLILPLAAAPDLLAELPRPEPHPGRRLAIAALALGAAGGIGWWWIQPDTQPLAGSIRDTGGEPIEGVEIILTEYDLTETTDRLGRFRFRVPAPAGTLVELVASSADHRGYRDYAAAGTTGLGIIME